MDKLVIVEWCTLSSDRVGDDSDKLCGFAAFDCPFAPFAFVFLKRYIQRSMRVEWMYPAGLGKGCVFQNFSSGTRPSARGRISGNRVTSNITVLIT